MAKFLRTTNGTAYIKLTWLELAKYSQNMHPVCDDCLKDVIGYENLILIPILNEAFCSECGKKVSTNAITCPHCGNQPHGRCIRCMEYQFKDENENPICCSDNHCCPAYVFDDPSNIPLMRKLHRKTPYDKNR